MFLGMHFESIEFFQKGLIRPSVFIREVFNGTKFKFVKDSSVNLTSANFRFSSEDVYISQCLKF